MLALIRYQLAVLGHSQRYLPPALLFIGLLAVFYSNNTGPALPGYTVTAGALFVVSGWLIVALIDAEDPVQRTVTHSRVGSLYRLLAGIVLTVLSCSAALTLLSVAWATLSHGGDYTLRELGIGVLAHMVCAASGVAVGLPCSRLLIHRVGYTVIMTALLMGVVLLVKWIPLVHPLLATLGQGRFEPSVLITSAVAGVAVVIASPLVVGLWHARYR